MAFTIGQIVSAASGVVPKFACGSLATSGTAADTAITLGFKPRYFKILNITDRLQDEWYEGMLPDHAVHTAVDGTVSHSTSNGFTIADSATTWVTATGYTAGTILLAPATGLYYRVVKNFSAAFATTNSTIALLLSAGAIVQVSDFALTSTSIIAAAEILITSKSYFYIAIG